MSKQMIDALKFCQKQFEFYAWHHANKGDTAKEMVNLSYAEMCAKALAAGGESVNAELLAALEEVVDAADSKGWSSLDAGLEFQRGVIAKAKAMPAPVQSIPPALLAALKSMVSCNFGIGTWDCECEWAAQVIRGFVGNCATPWQEPFGYFRPTIDGWENCSETDDGARPLYEHPAPAVAAPEGYRLIKWPPTPEMIEAFTGQSGPAVPAFFDMLWQPQNRSDRDKVEAMLNASPPAPVQDGWQPIETVPKDKRKVLLLTPDGECVSGCWIQFPEGIGGWRAFLPYGGEFVGWMPLPPAPAGKKGV